jgi:glycosyltransferase involved in cell wall biosynthesis
MKPLVSILIPAYNAEKWIADTLKSVLAQTWPRREIIVVDDGSRDGTLAIAKKFAAPEVQVVTQGNQGASAARNHAYSLCQGDYIQWLDADDLLDPEKIARQLAVAETVADKRTLYSSEWSFFMYRVNHPQPCQTTLFTDLTPVEWIYRKLAQNQFLPNFAWLASRELTAATGPWDTRLSLDDDGEYFCRMIVACSGIRFVPGAKSYYRIADVGSLSKVDRSDKKLESLWRSMQLHVGYLRSLEDSERTRAACVTYLGNWLNYFYPTRPDIILQAQALAQKLGGSIELPRLSWKYRWIEKSLGRTSANRVQATLPRLKMSAARFWDKTLYQWGR